MIFAYISFGFTPFIETYLDSNKSNESDPINILEADYYVDPRKYYVYIYIHGLQAAGIVILSYLSWDTCYLTFAQHSCSMFEILGYFLKI
jgi:hypothetical protein